MVTRHSPSGGWKPASSMGLSMKSASLITVRAVVVLLDVAV